MELDIEEYKKGFEIHVGDVIEYSKEGINRLKPRKPYRQGVCVGFSRDSRCVNLVWDGTKGHQSYHKSFIQIK